MSVYVDNYRAPLGRMIMCHMMADTTEELLAMADRIGVDRHHLQSAGQWKEHFDVCSSKRRLAVAAGAVETTARDLVRKMRTRAPLASGAER